VKANLKSLTTTKRIRTVSNALTRATTHQGYVSMSKRICSIIRVVRLGSGESMREGMLPELETRHKTRAQASIEEVDKAGNP